MVQQERTDPAGAARPSALRIADCVVLPALNRIERDEEVFQIEPRVMQVLVCLAARPGEVFSRQELFDRVWADSVVCEEALTRTISELRRVFRDDTRTPRVIETIRKGGYRLIAPVSTASAPNQGSALPPAEPGIVEPRPAEPPIIEPRPAEPPIIEPRPAEPATPASRSGPRRMVWIGSALAALVLLSAGIWGVRRFTRPDPAAGGLTEATPLTSSPGLEVFPALSPNGSMAAFAWAGERPGEGSSLDLYVMKVPNGSPARLASLPGQECWPSWSPDGTEIAFACQSNGSSEICMVPVSGGDVRRLARLEGAISGLDWSPDGRSLVYAAADGSNSSPCLHLLRLEDLSRTVLTHPAPRVQGDVAPAFSPDSRTVAFMRLNTRGEQDVCCLPVAGGEVRKLDLGGRRVSGLDWLSSDALILSASSKVDFGLWKVMVGSGRRFPLALPGGRVQRLSLARSGRRLAYEKITFAKSIWCVDLSPAGACRRRSEPLIASTRRESEPVFSPDGRAIAFVSDRTGTPEVWIADDAGGHARRVTDQKATHLTRPRWSPDGSRIVYACNRDGPLSMFVTDVASQGARRLPTVGPAAPGVWSRRGNFLYYGVETPAGFEVWRAGPDGTDPTRIGEAGREILGESPDGRGLYCVRSSDGGISCIPYDGGPESEIVPADRSRDWQEAVVADHGFYFTRRLGDVSTLGFYDLARGRADSLASLQWYAASLVLAPDGSALLYDSIGKIEVDLMLTEVAE